MHGISSWVSACLIMPYKYPYWYNTFYKLYQLINKGIYILKSFRWSNLVRFYWQQTNRSINFFSDTAMCTCVVCISPKNVCQHYAYKHIPEFFLLYIPWIFTKQVYVRRSLIERLKVKFERKLLLKKNLDTSRKWTSPSPPYHPIPSNNIWSLFQSRWMPNVTRLSNLNSFFKEWTIFTNMLPELHWREQIYIIVEEWN